MLLSFQFFTANILSQVLDMLVSLLEKWTKAALENSVLADFIEFLTQI